VFRAGWISDYNDPYSFLELFRTGHGRNDYGYSNRTFDTLLDEIGTERVRARRERLMFEAERVLMTDNVIIPIYTYVTKRLVSGQLRGWQNNVMDHHPTRHMFKLRLRGAPAGAGADSADPGPEGASAEADPLTTGDSGQSPPEADPEGQGP